MHTPPSLDLFHRPPQPTFPLPLSTAMVNPDRFDKFMKSLRLTGALTGLVVCALGIFLLVTLSLNPRNAVNAIYEIIFGLLMVVAECRFVRMLKYFYFMQHFLGLGMFYIYVGFLCIGGIWYEYAVAGVCLGIGLTYFILGLGCRKMGRENFKRSGVEPPATAVDGTASAPPAPGGGAKAAAAAPTGYGSGTAYGNNTASYDEPEAIRAARTNASAYSVDTPSAYANDEPPPAYGSEPAYGGGNQSAYSNDQGAYSNDGEQV